jgi:hypothetical protein
MTTFHNSFSDSAVFVHPPRGDDEGPPAPGGRGTRGSRDRPRPRPPRCDGTGTPPAPGPHHRPSAEVPVLHEPAAAGAVHRMLRGQSPADHALRRWGGGSPRRRPGGAGALTPQWRTRCSPCRTAGAMGCELPGAVPGLPGRLLERPCLLQDRRACARRPRQRRRCLLRQYRWSSLCVWATSGRQRGHRAPEGRPLGNHALRRWGGGSPRRRPGRQGALSAQSPDPMAFRSNGRPARWAP